MHIDDTVSPFDIIIQNYIKELELEFGIIPNHFRGVYKHLKKKLFSISKYHLFLQYSVNKQLNSRGIFKIDNQHEVCSEILLQKYKSKQNLPLEYQETINQVFINTKKYIQEVLSNFETDKISIAIRFQTPSDFTIQDILFLGDTHNRGQAALNIVFSSGLSLMYKPNKIRLAAIVKNVLRSYEDYFIIPRTIVRNEYYWEEYFDEKFNGLENLKISKAIGILLGFSQIACFSDLHFDNLIVHDGKLVLFDFETLFDYNVSTFNKEISVSGSRVKLGQSPLISSILPIWFKGIKWRLRKFFFHRWSILY